jgi:hypothetical protein
MERNRTDNDLLQRMDERGEESTDAFGKAIADGTRNTIDVPSIYSFSPERLRLYLDDARQEPGDVSAKFTDEEGNWLLEPAAGESFYISTAERPRYIVGYEANMSAASAVPSDLQSGDTFRVGGRDRQSPENQAFFEVNGDSPNRAVLVDEGTEVATSEWQYPDDAPVDVTSAVRYEITYNAYGVGRWRFNLSFTDESRDDPQVNTDVASLSVDGGFAISDYNFHQFQEIDAATSGRQLRAGSFGFLVKGNVQETTRTKAARLTDLSYGGSGDYEPVAALRVDPDRGNVYSQFKNVTVFPNSTSGELLVNVFSPDETDASGFSTPPQQNPENSVVEQTTSVTNFTDQDGNTVTSDPDPTGYQVGLARFESGGQGNSTRVATSQQTENKRPLYEDDVAVFLYKADSASSDTVNLTYFIEQDW